MTLQPISPQLHGAAIANVPAADKIGVCCIRDPRDAKVWSQTPKNICDQLEARGRFGKSIFGLPHTGNRMKLCAALTAFRYCRPGMIRRFVHGRSMRKAHAVHILEQMQSSGIKRFLHLAGDRYLPLPQKPAGSKHYLLIDATWDYWRDPDMPLPYLDAVDRDIARAYQEMDHIFSISEHTKASLVVHYGIPANRITVVGSGRGIIRPYLGPKDYAGCSVLFIAKERFEDKGGLLLFEGFKLAREKNPLLQLWLVGDPRLQELAAGYENVTVYGFLPLEQLQALFEQASLFAMPASREPWGLVFLEALSCRTPVLGLERGALPEITQGGRFGCLVKEPTAAAVAAGILDAFSDPLRLQRMGDEGQQYVTEHFTWGKMMDRMLSVIDGDSIEPAGKPQSTP